jgi:hypothetical protein
MKRLIYIMFVVIGAFAQSCYWWNVPSSGSAASNSTGYTVGQAYASNRTTHGTYGFWGENYEPQICLSITDSNWDIGSILPNTMTVMSLGDEIMVTNCGNCYVSYGLQFVRSDTLPWHIYTLADDNIFIMRAKFSIEATVPSIFDPIQDAISDELQFANGTRYGADGYGVPLGQQRRLWFYFKSPTRSASGENTLIFLLKAQIYIP